LKILFTSTGIHQKAGTYTVLKNISPILSKNHDVTILTNESNVDIECTNLIKLKTSFFPFPSYFNLPEFKKLVSNGFLEQFDIIHSFEYPIFLTDYLSKKKSTFSAPLIISAHGSIHQFNKFPNNILKKIHNKFMKKHIKNISLFIASTNAEKNHLLKYGIPENKLGVLPLGVRVSSIIRTPSEKKSIIYVGRLTVSKNIEVLIESISLSKRSDFTLIIAGKDFGMLNELKKLTKKLGLEKRVIFTGEISENEKIELFSEATIFVHPSLEDVFSLSLIEAAGSGVPSIAFDVEANSEILDNNCGRIVKNLSALSLANTIDNLLEQEHERDEISKNSVKLIPKKYDWNNTSKILEKFYLDLK
jgi:glycosyltransferase involved in cell wall biosynthesis